MCQPRYVVIVSTEPLMTHMETLMHVQSEPVGVLEGKDSATRENGRMFRWGGLAGILGSILMLVTFGIVAAFVGMDPLSPEEELMRFPDIEAARIVENSLYLGVLLLWVLHSLALNRALRRANPAAARFGTALSILGLAMLAAGALPHIATAPIAELYHAPGATPQDQATLVLLWQATYGFLDALLVTGLAILPLGLIALGTAMADAPVFGARMGRMSVALGVAGLAAAASLLVDVSSVAVVGVFALIAFHLTVGRRTYRVAGAARPTTLIE